MHIHMYICVYIQIFESKYDHTNTKHGKGGGRWGVGWVRVPQFNTSKSQDFSISTFALLCHRHFQHFNISLTIQDLNISTFKF